MDELRKRLSAHPEFAKLPQKAQTAIVGEIASSLDATAGGGRIGAVDWAEIEQIIITVLQAIAPFLQPAPTPPKK
jgi:hypothetical protein